MPTRLLVAPAASGKTHHCIARVRETLRASPLVPTWVVLPDRHQVAAWRRRLAEQGGALGMRIGTFADLHGEILALAGAPMPIAAEPVVHRLARAAIDALAEQERLPYFAPIRREPGLAYALTRLVAELKRARIYPEVLARATQGRGQRLEELARLYGEYQHLLQKLEWADVEGLGWLANLALEDNSRIAVHWKLIIADGFDVFYPTQLDTLKLLAARADEILLTLTGDPRMKRRAYTRFKRTFELVTRELAPQIETLARCETCAPALAHLETNLFEAVPDKIDPGRTITFVAAQTLALEAREALRWLKTRIVRDGVKPDECAIIARDLAPYRADLARVGVEFGVPLRFADGEWLVSNPAVAAIMNVLELPISRWQRRQLIDALRTPYFDHVSFKLKTADAFRFDQVARWGSVVEGIEQWRDSFEHLIVQAASALETEDAETQPPTLPQGDAARALWHGLQKFVARVEPPARASFVQFIAWLENLISDDPAGLAVLRQADAQNDTAERDRAALAGFFEVIRALVLSEKIVGARADISYEEFFSDLRGALEAATYVPENPRRFTEARVYCAGLAQARGVPFRAVAILGLSEGSFPAPVSEDAFLPDADREQLRGARLEIETRARDDQQSLFYEAVTRAREFLLLTRSYLADDGEPWVESPYWTAACELVTAGDPQIVRAEDARAFADCASPAEVLTYAVRQRGLPDAYRQLEPAWNILRHTGRVLRARGDENYQGEWNGGLGTVQSLLSQKFGAQKIWSASAFETFTSCGFRFLFDTALKLEEREAPQAGYAAAQLGGMLHAILENVYQRVSDPADTDAVLTVLPQVAAEVFQAAPAQFGFRPNALWAKQKNELGAVLAQTIRNLADKQAAWSPAWHEKSFGDPPLEIDTPAGRVRMHGRIDRVDRDADGNLCVIDYKTGASHLEPRALGEGERLQLPIYALGVERALRLGKVVDGFYWAILKGKAGALLLAKFKFKDAAGNEYVGLDGAVALTLAHIGNAVANIRAGNFAPQPPRGGCPDYCVARTICWRYEPAERR